MAILVDPSTAGLASLVVFLVALSVAAAVLANEAFERLTTR